MISQENTYSILSNEERTVLSGGKVNVLRLPKHDEIREIEIVSEPDKGNLVIRPDNSLAVVLSKDVDFHGQLDFGIKVKYSDGQILDLELNTQVEPSTQEAGWNLGQVYMLEEDSNNDVVVEYGENHQKVFISGHPEALGIESIARIEEIDSNVIDGAWLNEHPFYGKSSDFALDSEAGILLWKEITGSDVAPNSNWLLFERGYEYDISGNLIANGTAGESPLHPVHITSYGTGQKPILDTRIKMVKDEPSNIVFSEIAVTGGVQVLGGKNILFDGADISMIDGLGATGVSVQFTEGFTLRNSSIVDVYRTVPESEQDTVWTNHMSSGLLISRSENVLIEGSLFDHNGWAPNFEPDLSLDGGQAPTKFNHNLYAAVEMEDLTIRDNLFLRGSSIGAKVMEGAFFQDNVMVDNQIGSLMSGGNQGKHVDTKSGSFTFYSGNLITSAGHKEIELGSIGALSRGADFKGYDAVLEGNIIAHLANPNDPIELLHKTTGNHALRLLEDPLVNDTKIFNWQGANGRAKETEENTSKDTNVKGVDESVLNNTTIQKYAEQKLGNTDATIGDLALYFRDIAKADGLTGSEADYILDYFSEGFESEKTEKTMGDTFVFLPHFYSDGVRWDNDSNWQGGLAPHSDLTSNVDIGGNWVDFGSTTTIQTLNLGSEGILTVGSGRLQVNDSISAGKGGGTISINDVGQFWSNGGISDSVNIIVEGGRFANFGHQYDGMNLTVKGGQALLASDGVYTVGRHSKFKIEGSSAKVGFDGRSGDLGVLKLERDSTIEFSSDTDGISTIGKFHSGAFATSGDFVTGANLGGGSITVDLTNFSSPRLGDSHTIIQVDEIVGSLGDVTINGLGEGLFGSLIVDYLLDIVSVNISDASSDHEMVRYIGTPDDVNEGSIALLDQLTRSAPVPESTVGEGGDDDSAILSLEAVSDSGIASSFIDAEVIIGSNGTENADIIYESGDENVIAGGGDDFIFLGGRTEGSFRSVWGGEGIDHFVINRQTDDPRIRDFTPGIDKIVLSDGLTVEDIDFVTGTEARWASEKIARYYVLDETGSRDKDNSFVIRTDGGWDARTLTIDDFEAGFDLL